MSPDQFYRTTSLSEIKRIITTGMQPLRVELCDNKFLLFTFPATAAPPVITDARQ